MKWPFLASTGETSIRCEESKFCGGREKRLSLWAKQGTCKPIRRHLRLRHTVLIRNGTVDFE